MPDYKKIITQLSELSDHDNAALILDSIQDLIKIGLLDTNNSNLKLVNASIKELLDSCRGI